MPPYLPSRRRLLKTFGAAAATALSLPALGKERVGIAQVPYLDYPFQLGVASGDPWPDGFVIWTRVAPKPLEPGFGMPKAPVEVSWDVAADEQFKTIVAKGTKVAFAELGHAVHVEVTGLEPGRDYFYRFSAGSFRSPRGRARTAPAAGAPTERVRFAVAGCQDYEQGHYTAFRHLSREGLDFVFHYGDYIYEGWANRATYLSRYTNQEEAKPRRLILPESVSLDDYRLRYGHYRSDPDLQAAHAAAPWVAVWDDHEVDNNWVGELDSRDTPPEVFLLRRVAAAQAYYEHMPLRRSSWPLGPAVQLYRRFAFGDLLDLHVLDTRQYRDEQPCGDDFKAGCADRLRAGAQVLGQKQEAWLLDGLGASKARWNGIAQQIMVMPFARTPDPEPLRNMDSWEGYADARRRLVRGLEERKRRNVVVLTGDEHQGYAGEIKRDDQDPTSAPVMTEFVATSISSGGDGGDQRPLTPALLEKNPHVKLINDQRGYLVCDVRRDRWEAGFKVLDQVSRPGGTLSTRAKFAVEPDRPGLNGA